MPLPPLEVDETSGAVLENDVARINGPVFEAGGMQQLDLLAARSEERTTSGGQDEQLERERGCVPKRLHLR